MYVLDTNAVSEPIKSPPNAIFMHTLATKRPELLYMTSITVMELRFGAMKRKDAERFWKRIEAEAISKYAILDFGEPEAILAADLTLSLTKRGELIGFEDTMIASVALSHGFTVVTRNEKHFRRIPELRIENWWG